MDKDFFVKEIEDHGGMLFFACFPSGGQAFCFVDRRNTKEYR